MFRIDRKRVNSDAWSYYLGDLHHASYYLLNAIVLPSEIGAEDPSRLTNDGGRDEKVITSCSGGLPQNRILPLRNSNAAI